MQESLRLNEYTVDCTGLSGKHGQHGHGQRGHGHVKSTTKSNQSGK